VIVVGVNKVDLSSGEVLIDLTKDSVTPDKLASGVTAHDKSGNKITGTMPIPTFEPWLLEMEDGSTVEKAVSVNA
jgi:hypothetical protein